MSNEELTHIFIIDKVIISFFVFFDKQKALKSIRDDGKMSKKA